MVIGVVLWVIAVAARLGLDALVAGGSGQNGNVGDATIALYLAVSFGVQQFFLLRRAERQEAAGQMPVREPSAPCARRTVRVTPSGKRAFRFPEYF